MSASSRTQGNAQHDERISLQHFVPKNAVAPSQGARKAFQFDPPSCNDALAYAVCQCARWRCEVCQMAHGSQVFGFYGFSRVILTVDCQARRPRALCQRCRLAATDEMPVLMPARKKPVIGRVKLLKAV